MFSPKGPRSQRPPQPGGSKRLAAGFQNTGNSLRAAASAPPKHTKAHHQMVQAPARQIRSTSTPKTVQRFTSRVVQAAVKYYPNLHPGAVEPVNPDNIFRLNSFAD